MRTVKIEKKEEIEQVIRSCKTCYVAMCWEDQPYVIPMNFAFDGERVILHSARSGRKWEILQRNPRVCIQWTKGEDLAWQDEEVGCSYRVISQTVMVEGIAEIVEDFNEKEQCMHQFMAQYSSLSFRFSRPSIENVGVIRVPVRSLSAFKFGEKSQGARKTSSNV